MTRGRTEPAPRQVARPRTLTEGKTRRSRRPWAPWLFILPFLVLNGVFFVYPFINSVFLAFHQTAGPRAKVFVGLENFTFVLTDPDFHTAVWNTTIYAAASLVVQLPCSLGLAMLLNARKDRLKGAFRLILFSPHLVGPIFVGILFSVLFMPRYGLFNRFLQSLIGWGLEERWLQEPALVMPALVLVAMWMHVGFNMIYFLAALQNVDESLVEAARIDGAGPWKVFVHVILPQIKPVVLFVVIITTIGSYKLFELPYALLRGYGPKNSGLTIVGYLYRTAFDSGDLGTGAAIGWLLALIIFTISLAQMRISKSLGGEA
jgi:ABC-type sugar transport system permease subunit